MNPLFTLGKSFDCCGIHLINGAFMYGSSRSQKVVSLSSCESELHALVSCACDGIFIKAFFPSNAFVASARSFNMFNCMLQTSVN